MSSGEEQRWDVFLAHASADKPRARALYAALTALGLKVFLDEESLLPGDDWMASLPGHVRASKVVVVLVSGQTAAAHYQGEEIVIAVRELRRTGGRLIPVHLAPDLDDPYGLARLHHLSWHDADDVAPLADAIASALPQATSTHDVEAQIFCHRIPPPPRFFTGRDTLLRDLARRLDDGNTTTLTQTTTFQGMGGVGKTTAAAALCDARRHAYDIVWWIRAEDPATLTADLAELAEAVGLATGDKGDVDAETARRWLESTDRPWLLVYDNAPDLKAVRPWLPMRGSGGTIITSRHRQFSSVGRVLSVGIFADETAAAFLRDRVRDENPKAAEEDLTEVLLRLGGLPLALEQAAAWVERLRSRRFADWVDLYDDAAREPFPDGTRPDGYDHTAATAWRVSIDAASAEAHLAGPLLAAMSFLAPDDIAARWLRDAAVARPLGGSTIEDVDAAIVALNAYSLIAVTDDDTIDIHRVIQRTARAEAGQESAILARSMIVQQNPGDTAHEHWPRLAALAPHAQAVAKTTPRDLVDGARGLVRALSIAALAHRDHGQVKAAIELATTAESLGASTITESAAYLIATDALGRCLTEAGEFDRAISLLDETLTANARILGADHEDTLSSKNNLASAYLAAGDPVRARPLLEETLAAREDLLGADHPDTLTSRSVLAHAHYLAGHADLALPLLEKTFETRTRIFGRDDPATLKAAHNLASTYRELERLDDAIPLFETTLADRLRILGPDHPQTLTSRNNLADAHEANGDVAKAVLLLEENRHRREQVLGLEHPDTLTGWHNLATVLDVTGDPERALSLHEAAFDGFRKVLGGDHPTTRKAHLSLQKARRRAGSSPSSD